MFGNPILRYAATRLAEYDAEESISVFDVLNFGPKAVVNSLQQ
jgi:hypothetical protein